MEKVNKRSLFGRFKQKAERLRAENGNFKGATPKLSTNVPANSRAEFKSKISFDDEPVLPSIHPTYRAAPTLPKSDTIRLNIASGKPRYCAKHQAMSEHQSMPNVALPKVTERKTGLNKTKSILATRQQSHHVPCVKEPKRCQRRQRRPHRPLTFICDGNRCYQIDAVPRLSFPNSHQRIPKGVLVCDGLTTCMVDNIPMYENVYSPNRQQVVKQEVPQQVQQEQAKNSQRQVEQERQPCVYVKQERQPCGPIKQECQPCEPVKEERKPCRQERQPCRPAKQKHQPCEPAKQERQPRGTTTQEIQPCEPVKEERMPCRQVRQPCRPATKDHQQYVHVKEQCLPWGNIKEKRQQCQPTEEVTNGVTSAIATPTKPVVAEEHAIFICNQNACYQVTEVPKYALPNRFPESLSGVFICDKTDHKTIDYHTPTVRNNYSINRYINSKEPIPEKPTPENVFAQPTEEPPLLSKHAHTKKFTRHHVRHSK